MTDKDTALQLVAEIAAAQGAVFLRELLRAKRREDPRIRIGGKKADIIQNLADAIREDRISLAELRGWLAETEGWGKEHSYLYRVPTGLARSRLWNPEEFPNLARERGLAIPRTRTHLLRFPASLTLTELAVDEEEFRASWHKGAQEWQRDSTMDYQEEIEGDRYEFRAWRQRHIRSVVRFILQPRARRACLFVQLPLRDEHDEAVAAVQGTLNSLFDFDQLQRVSISRGIVGLDSADLDQGPMGQRIRAQDTRFRAEGATIQFAADDQLGSYLEVEPVRHVRRAVRTDAFTGDLARFRVDLALSTGGIRTVTVSLDGSQDRLYFFAQMSAADVWAVLDAVYHVTQ